jgi:hypothetical protein
MLRGWHSGSDVWNDASAATSITAGELALSIMLQILLTHGGLQPRIPWVCSKAELCNCRSNRKFSLGFKIVFDVEVHPMANHAICRSDGRVFGFLPE